MSVLRNIDGYNCAAIDAKDSVQDTLFTRARELRNRNYGNRLFIRAVIELSNYCGSSCQYCGMRMENEAITRYRLSPGQILDQVRVAGNSGIRTLMLQSGQDPEYDYDVLGEIIAEARELGMVDIILCVGVLEPDVLRHLRSAGATTYLLKHETANAKLFSEMKPGCLLEERFVSLENARRVGYEIGSGAICGLPGQTLEDLWGGIALLSQLNPEMASVSPFIPNSGSPLRLAKPGTIERTLNMIALLRIVLPTALIPAVSALEKVSKWGQSKGLLAGANVMTVNMTPGVERKHYMLYDNSRVIVNRGHVERCAAESGMEIVYCGEHSS